MTPRHLFVGTAAAVLVAGSVIVPGSAAQAHPAASPPRPVTQVTRLESRPDIAAAFGLDVGGFRMMAAASLSGTATEGLGPMTTDAADRLGRSTYYRAQDVELYAVPPRAGRSDTPRSHSYGVIAVPLHSTVHPDGSVSPPPTQSTGLIDPSFSNMWGTEDYFHWIYYDLDDGGFACANTRGELRGQWEYSRLANVAPTSAYDYWGFAQRAVAVITQRAGGLCRNTIDWAKAMMQSRAPGAYPARQDPLTGSSGSCITKTLSVGGSFGGVNASISQPVQRCETWSVTGALAASASQWYGVTYDNNGLWGKYERELAALAIVRVPRGAPHQLYVLLDIDVDNQ